VDYIQHDVFLLLRDFEYPDSMFGNYFTDIIIDHSIVPTIYRIHEKRKVFKAFGVSSLTALFFDLTKSVP